MSERSKKSVAHNAPVDAYAQPETHTVVHVARATEPVPVVISEETQRRHKESRRLYPSLNLSPHEYVISAVRRHSVGLWGTIATMTIIIALVFVVIIDYAHLAELVGLPVHLHSYVTFLGILLISLVVLGGYMAMWVYMHNHFFLTNESVIQEIQQTIFSKREQTVSLMNIEDASYTQHGLLQTVLDYGSIRLSTEGEETTYRFDFVAHPKQQIAILNNAVEAFKNGRPVE